MLRDPVARRKLEPVLERREQDGEAVAATAGRARQIDHERRAAQPGDASRQQRMRRSLARVRADRLGNPGRLTVDDPEGRFGSHVTRREARAAGGQDDRRRPGERRDRVLDPVGLVRDHATLDVEPPTGEQLLQEVSALVLARPLVDAVRDGENGRSQGTFSFVFDTSVTSVTTISLSIALAMS